MNYVPCQFHSVLDRFGHIGSCSLRIILILLCLAQLKLPSDGDSVFNCLHSKPNSLYIITYNTYIYIYICLISCMCMYAYIHYYYYMHVCLYVLTIILIILLQ